MLPKLYQILGTQEIVLIYLKFNGMLPEDFL